MYSFKVATLFFAALAAANTITLKSLDSTGRTVYFTGNDGGSGPGTVYVEGGASVDVDVPESWAGNLYAVQDGAENIPGMLAEFAFQGYGNNNFYDVSAIVNANDLDNVKEIYPADSGAPVSGCSSFPCGNAYYLPDDIQTKSTTETTLIVTLGSNGSVSKRRNVENFPRSFVTGNKN